MSEPGTHAPAVADAVAALVWACVLPVALALVAFAWLVAGGGRPRPLHAFVSAALLGRLGHCGVTALTAAVVTLQTWAWTRGTCDILVWSWQTFWIGDLLTCVGFLTYYSATLGRAVPYPSALLTFIGLLIWGVSALLGSLNVYIGDWFETLDPAGGSAWRGCWVGLRLAGGPVLLGAVLVHIVLPLFCLVLAITVAAEYWQLSIRHQPQCRRRKQLAEIKRGRRLHWEEDHTPNGSVDGRRHGQQPKIQCLSSEVSYRKCFYLTKMAGIKNVTAAIAFCTITFNSMPQLVLYGMHYWSKVPVDFTHHILISAGVLHTLVLPIMLCRATHQARRVSQNMIRRLCCKPIQHETQLPYAVKRNTSSFDHAGSGSIEEAEEGHENHALDIEEYVVVPDSTVTESRTDDDDDHASSVIDPGNYVLHRGRVEEDDDALRYHGSTEITEVIIENEALVAIPEPPPPPPVPGQQAVMSEVVVTDIDHVDTHIPSPVDDDSVECVESEQQTTHKLLIVPTHKDNLRSSYKSTRDNDSLNSDSKAIIDERDAHGMQKAKAITLYSDRNTSDSQLGSSYRAGEGSRPESAGGRHSDPPPRYEDTLLAAPGTAVMLTRSHSSVVPSSHTNGSIRRHVSVVRSPSASGAADAVDTGPAMQWESTLYSSAARRGPEANGQYLSVGGSHKGSPRHSGGSSLGSAGAGGGSSSFDSNSEGWSNLYDDDDSIYDEEFYGGDTESNTGSIGRQYKRDRRRSSVASVGNIKPSHRRKSSVPSITTQGTAEAKPKTAAKKAHKRRKSKSVETGLGQALGFTLFFAQSHQRGTVIEVKDIEKDAVDQKKENITSPASAQAPPPYDPQSPSTASVPPFAPPPPPLPTSKASQLPRKSSLRRSGSSSSKKSVTFIPTPPPPPPIPPTVANHSQPNLATSSVAQKEDVSSGTAMPPIRPSITPVATTKSIQKRHSSKRKAPAPPLSIPTAPPTQSTTPSSPQIKSSITPQPTKAVQKRSSSKRKAPTPPPAEIPPAPPPPPIGTQAPVDTTIKEIGDLPSNEIAGNQRTGSQPAVSAYGPVPFKPGARKSTKIRRPVTYVNDEMRHIAGQSSAGSIPTPPPPPPLPGEFHPATQPARLNNLGSVNQNGITPSISHETKTMDTNSLKPAGNFLEELQRSQRKRQKEVVETDTISSHVIGGTNVGHGLESKPLVQHGLPMVESTNHTGIMSKSDDVYI